MRLYKVTHNSEHLRLARFFLYERGSRKGPGNQLYYDLEAKRRGEVALPPHLPLDNPMSYYQADKLILGQTSVERLSVRCMYLLTGIADLCIVDLDAIEKYLPVLKRLWNNMVQKKMYLTGGIGAEAQWEGFREDYFLPQSSDEGGCYSETCAAIGVVMLAERLLQVSLLTNVVSRSVLLIAHLHADGAEWSLCRHHGAQSLQRITYGHVA